MVQVVVIESPISIKQVSCASHGMCENITRHPIH